MEHCPLCGKSNCSITSTRGRLNNLQCNNCNYNFSNAVTAAVKFSSSPYIVGTKYWLSPTGEFHMFPANQEHKDFFEGENSSQLEWNGWTRIRFLAGKELQIVLRKKNIEWILEQVQTRNLPVKKVYVEDQNSHVLAFDVEDNDLLESYKNYMRRRHLIQASIKLSFRDVLSYSPWTANGFGRIWLDENGNETYIKTTAHEIWAVENVPKLFPDWKEYFDKYGRSVALTGYDDEVLFLYLKGWTKIWNNNITTTQKQVKILKDFIIIHKEEANPTSRINIVIFKNDLSNIFQSRYDFIEEWLD